MDFVEMYSTTGEEKSVQLVRVAFFRFDFLQNPYFSSYSIDTISESFNMFHIVLVPHPNAAYLNGK